MCRLLECMCTLGMDTKEVRKRGPQIYRPAIEIVWRGIGLGNGVLLAFRRGM